MMNDTWKMTTGMHNEGFNPYGLSQTEIAKKLHLPDFWGMQLFRYIHNKIPYPEFPEKYKIPSINEPLTCIETLKDGYDSIKYVFETNDNKKIEAVLLYDKNNSKTVCLSSQIGCPLRCSFCATGKMGFIRNLTTAEIVYQLAAIAKAAGTINKVVFMGMGEALLNWKNVEKSIHILTHPKGQGIGISRITVSTLGLAEKINHLIQSNLRPGLAISLPSVIKETCNRITPGRPFNQLIDLKESMNEYQKKKKRRLVIETVLLKGINDTEGEMKALCDYLEGLNCLVNLIPYNSTDNCLQPPGEDRIKELQTYIQSRKFVCTVRYNRGYRVSGGCGQLGS